MNKTRVRMLCDTGAVCNCMLGRVHANFKVGECLLSAEFYVIDKLTQDVILDVNFFERSGALLDYKHQRLTLYDGTVCVPLVTAIDPTGAVCTTRRTRIPARHEAKDRTL